MIEVMSVEQYNAMLLDDAYSLLMKARKLSENSDCYSREANEAVDEAEYKLAEVYNNLLKTGKI